MDVVIGLSIFIIGAITGVMANKFLSATSQQQQLAEKAKQSETELAQYKLDVAEHLDSSAKLLAQMNSTCQTAMQQMEQSTLLLQQATPDASENIPFFSQETQEQLAQTVSLRHSKDTRKGDVEITEAPLDYSDDPSGIFNDTKQSVTNS